MSQLLRPSMLDDFGLVPTLQWLTERFSARTRIVVDLRTPPADSRLPSAIEVLLYRVTQEALTNIMKHAKARHVEIELRVTDDEAALTIADDGVGFDVERASGNGGLGLVTMHERAELMHATLAVHSTAQRGTEVRISVPLDRQHALVPPPPVPSDAPIAAPPPKRTRRRLSVLARPRK